MTAGPVVRTPDILVVCTANQARSPVLAALLQRHADERAGPGSLLVGSAGTDAQVGMPAVPGARAAAEVLGVSVADHRSMPVMMVPAAQSRLAITMTRRHQADVTRRFPDLGDRTFTLLELSRLIERAQQEGAPEVAASSPDPPRERLDRVVAGANRRRPVRGRRRKLDVPDPVGGGPAAFDAMAHTFQDAMVILADALLGPRRA